MPADLSQLDTPCLVVDRAKVAANAERLKSHLAKLGVPLRLHVKTAKSLEVVEAVVGPGRPPITVSTLKEAEQFFDARLPGHPVRGRVFSCESRSRACAGWRGAAT